MARSPKRHTARSKSPKRRTVTRSKSPKRRTVKSPKRRTVTRSKSPKRRTTRSKSPKRRTTRSKSPKRRTARSKSPKRRTTRSKSPKRRTVGKLAKSARDEYVEKGLQKPHNRALYEKFKQMSTAELRKTKGYKRIPMGETGEGKARLKKLDLIGLVIKYTY